MGEVDEDKSGGGGLGLGFALPQKLIRTDEYLFGSVSTCPPTVSIGGPPLLCSKGGVCDAQGAPAAATRANPFRSQAAGHGGIAPCMRFPLFTPAQWQELQRQALIYKHLVASVPIPIELLFDSRGLQTTPSLYPTMAGCGSGGVYYGLRFSADNADPEPGRCRRTDGKKWRCTRDAAPDQKYCERHMHRGRPRSRKPVERSPKNAVTSSTHSSPNVVNPTGGTITLTNAAGGQAPPAEPLSVEARAPLPRPEVKFPFLSTATEKETRYMDWMQGAVEGVHSNGTTVPQSYHHEEDPCCYSFLNPEAASLDHPRQPRRFFIDAWSVEGHSVPSAAAANHEALRDETCAQASPGGLSASTLTLSMSGSGEDHGHVRQMGLPTLGGPLGEVLRLSSVASPRDGSAGACENGRGYFHIGLASLVEKSRGAEERVSPRESPPPRVLPSSPTGVLQRTLVSLSDSSSNSSPKFAGGGGGRSELGLQWTCPAKKWS